MPLVPTDLELPHLQRNADDFAVVRAVAESGNDGPVLMLNLNRYKTASGFPDGGLYKQYMDAMPGFLESTGARLLWRFPVFGQAVGDQIIHEVLACWYPFHQTFLTLYDAPGAAENFRLKSACVEYAVIHRCPGDRAPFAP